MNDAKPGRKHPLNSRLVWDGMVFVVVLAVSITFYIVAFHPF